ncbi:DUF2076 domain-containing protein [Undibacterium sp. FT79W]|uniref:DUF2076 domain-containing protein n=1 Tax=Undibacterium sp. FT79W TaxID=2762296 RepID=UPI00164C5EBD|nr:DUF2076 domain-containing protein [Undibacterium sp. FT79W]MBC3877410.1 DUF2076 domain-containing protein [Undibacterium sp. FT79W]
MSPQEMQVLQNFLAQLVQVQGVAKDPQAASLISEAISKQPDASYLLVQRALLLEQALANANSQIASLQADLREQQALNATQNPTTPTQFLDPAASNWGNSASSRPLNIPSNTGTSVTGAPLAAYPATAAVPVSQPGAAATAPASSFFGNTGGSMLGTVAATAASVAAGAFLFQGISHLMNGNSHQTMADNSSTANLSNADGGLLPGYFDQDQTDSSPLESLSDESDDVI